MGMRRPGQIVMKPSCTPDEGPSWYAASARPAPAQPALRGEHTADVAILGGGYTGLSAALELAQRGYRVAVVEAGMVGGGASGRNGGQLITGFNPSFTTLAARHGLDDTRALFELAESGKRLLRDRVARHGIACGLTWGFACAALKPRQLDELAAEAALLQRFGYDGLAPWSAAELRAVVRSRRYIGGWYDAGS